MPNDQDIQRMMKDLGRAVVHAISTSEDVSQVVRRIRHEGFSLSLVLNCEQDDGGRREAKLDLTPRPPASPSFRLDTKDVALLKSLGIDATRSGSRRRGS